MVLVCGDWILPVSSLTVNQRSGVVESSVDRYGALFRKRGNRKAGGGKSNNHCDRKKSFECSHFVTFLSFNVFVFVQKAGRKPVRRLVLAAAAYDLKNKLAATRFNRAF